MEKKILITGGKGFIGGYLKKYLIEHGYQVIAPSSRECNVLEKKWFQEYADSVYHVIHLAGKTFVPQSWKEPEDFFDVNLMGTLNVIQFCREYNIAITYISAYIYGQPEKIPISESEKVNPNNPYAKSKYMAEELCEFYSKHYNMDISVLRLFNVFGPNQGKHFLIPFIIEQALSESNKIEVQDLAPKRDYIYIEDVCHAIALSCMYTKGYQVYNVGSGKSYAVYEVIDMVQNLVGSKKQVMSKNNIRKNEMSNVVADITNIRKKWGWEPITTMEEGLFRCLQGEKK